MKENSGLVIFFTGLSGSGKSTLAKELEKSFTEGGRKVTLLDGDAIRASLSRGLGFSKEDRAEHILRVGFVASEVAKHGGIAICPVISPYDVTRKNVRWQVESRGGKFILVYLKTSLEECERRDVKGLYKKARKGEIDNFTGISDPYEPPEDAEIIIDTENFSIYNCIKLILEKIYE